MHHSVPVLARPAAGTGPRDCDHHIISAVGNPGGDSFCFLMEHVEDAEHTVAYSISCKSTSRNRTTSNYVEEYNKAVSNYVDKAVSKRDFFMEFSSGSYSAFTPFLHAKHTHIQFLMADCRTLL